MGNVLAILFSGFNPLAAIAVSVAPFGIPATPFWIYVCAALIFVAGMIRILPELPREHGIDRILPFGRLFFAMPMAVFASEHFTLTPVIAGLVPRWIPWHTFWAYLVGAAFFCAALSIATLVQARLAATLLGATFLIFVLIMDLPAAVTHPSNRFFWALALRELSFGAAALAFAMSPWSSRRRQPSPARNWVIVPRLFIAIGALFYGIEDVLHPRFVPVVPLQKLTPEWIHGRIFIAFLVGVMLIAGGICFLMHRTSRIAGTVLAMTILLAILWVYLPMLIAAPADLVALNYFFDTLLYCGAILLLTGALDPPTSALPSTDSLRQSAN